MIGTYRFTEYFEEEVLRKRPDLKREWCIRVSEGVVLDYDAKGNLVGIDIDNASKKVQLDQLILNKLPAHVTSVAV
jgi:uncharacterized protein YuzE